ncbi:hypothetical protein Droror1_Dr00004822 [Drosera rotundifolia]
MSQLCIVGNHINESRRTKTQYQHSGNSNLLFFFVFLLLVSCPAPGTYKLNNTAHLLQVGSTSSTSSTSKTQVQEAEHQNLARFKKQNLEPQRTLSNRFFFL